jgi:outer membrane receptor protein involved in Fe transport
MKKHKVTLAILAMLKALSASADGDAKLDHFLSLSLVELMAQDVTISSDSRQPLAKAPGVVSLITAEDIKATGATNLEDVLKSVPGIHIRQSQFADRPLIQFRGANANQTLLMVDGSPMKDLVWGFGIYFQRIPVNMIERIEIIRGPGSALYGADASAGVINIITKTASGITHDAVGLRVGSYDTRTGWLQAGGDWQGLTIGFSANVSDTDGYNPHIAADAQTITDAQAGSHVSYAPGDALYGAHNDDFRLSLAKGYWKLLADVTRQSDLHTGISGAGVLDPVTAGNSNRSNYVLSYENPQFDKDWAVKAELRYQDLDYGSGDGFQERPPGYSSGGQTYPIGVINQVQNAERFGQIQLGGTYSGFSAHSVQLAVGASTEKLYSVRQIVNDPADPARLIDISNTPQVSVLQTPRNIVYGYLQDIWTITHDWDLITGARYDHYSDFGGTFNPHVALVWQSTDKLTTKLMYGQAFRAPSYQEIYANTSLSLSNPALGPERSRTWDLLFSYVPSAVWHASLDFYHIAQSDLISSTGSPSQYQNVGSNDIQGFELEGQWQATEAVRVSGYYTYHD